MNFIYGICFQESLAWGVKSFFIHRQILTKYKKRKYMFKFKHFTYIHEGMTNDIDQMKKVMTLLVTLPKCSDI